MARRWTLGREATACEALPAEGESAVSRRASTTVLSVVDIAVCEVYGFAGCPCLHDI